MLNAFTFPFKINSHFTSYVLAELIVEFSFSLSPGNLSYFVLSMHFKIIVVIRSNACFKRS